MDDLLSGFDDLEKELAQYISNVEDVQSVLEVGARSLVDDIEKLGKPYSKIKKSGYTHMLDSMSYRRARNNEVEVGAGVHWLRFVNDGTSPSSKRNWGTPKQPFLTDTYERNKNKYNKKMLKKLGMER